MTQRCLRALTTWRDPRGVVRVWALPAAIIGWGLLSVLWQPNTVPDQPWASRQLVPVALPGLVVLAVWVAARLTARAHRRGAGSVVVPVTVTCFVAALAVPPAGLTFGIGSSQAKTPAVRLALTGLALKHSNRGELGAVQALCQALPGRSSVVFLDLTAARRFTQAARGVCGLPAGAVTGQTAEVDSVVRGIEQAGRRPVLLATQPSELTAYGAAPRRVIDLGTEQDAHVLTQPPTSTWPVRYTLYMSSPGGVLSGF
jgi:hypothetical protein